MHTIAEEIYTFDQPLIFSFCAHGQLWAATAIGDMGRDHTQAFMVAPTTPHTVERVLNSHIPVDCLFLAPGPYYSVRITWTDWGVFSAPLDWALMPSQEATRNKPKPLSYLHPKGRQP